MKRVALLLFCIFAAAGFSSGQDKILNVVVIGAHPDDCDVDAGGTALKFVSMGHRVMFVSLTNGDAGHYKFSRSKLEKIRRAEAQEAGRRFGVKYVVLDNHDGELVPSLKVRHQVIRLIREWNADIVIGPRSNDYHADHRNTAIAIQDAAYLVIVPSVVPNTPALKKNPVFLYTEDSFKKPIPFTSDIVVDISDVIEKKIYAMSAHESQFFDWLPWTSGKLDQVPSGEKERLAWLFNKRAIGTGNRSKFTESFEICEYGSRPDKEQIQKLFPMIK